MKILLGAILTTMLLSGEFLVPISAAQPALSAQIIKGDLLTIKGETYIVRSISGVLMYLRVDKDTKRDRLIVPGERIEAQMSPEGRVLAIKPAP